MPHTELPWKALKSHEDISGPMWDLDPVDREWFENAPYTSIVGPEGQTVVTAHDAFTFREGDAAFIVRAVSNHETLVEALNWINSWFADYPADGSRPPAWMLTNVQTLLAKLED